MSNKKILVLGGNGFIGHIMCKKLIENGYDVEVFSRKPKTHNLLTGVKYTYGDFLDHECLNKVLERHTTVLHLISTITPLTSISDPFKGYQDDLIQTVKILEILQKNKGRMFFSSSGGTVYGIQETFPINETAQTKPINHYGIIKLSIEKIIHMYNTIHSMNNVIFRISNPYGPGQDYRVGGVGVIDAFLRKSIAKEEIEIYGDGNTARDFIYIDVLCECLYKIIDREFCINEIYNIGSGISYTLNEIIQTIQEELGFELKIKYLNKRGIDAPKIELDISRFVNEFGVLENFSLREGIKKTLQVYNLWESTGVDLY